MNKPNNNTTAGITVDSLLGVAFIVLKLTHVIDWGWGWVLAPFWIPLAIVFLVLIAAVIKVVLQDALHTRSKTGKQQSR